ncbi:endo alpha-1,4 polygalactosaminidase [Amycolatopsis pigmentata]|uniref:Endo alpha-1,4 polygalactosaminidase n=1 Tax=Amycolatopsis pigmentata TaxID=450801 RepID=A0ABW5FUR1_9PSEU
MTQREIRLPAVDAVVDYQLGGAYSPPAGVSEVVRDSTASTVPGLYNICYVNGYQTQPGERETWLASRRDLLLSGPDGRPRTDPDWPDEFLLDTSAETKRRRLTDIVGQTIRGCRQSGFDAVEIDNLDSFSRSGGALTAEDNLAYAAELAGVAHAAGLAVAQKNAAELGPRARRQAGFDFAVAEECAAFQECAAYRSAYDDRVIDIEYTDNAPASFSEVCADPATPKSTILRDRRLVPAGDPSYTYRHC